MIEQQGAEQSYGAVVAPDSTIGKRTPVATTIHGGSKSRLRPYEKTFLWVSRTIIIVFIILTILPIYLIVESSLSAGTSLFQFSILPQHPTLDHYRSLFDLNQVDFLLWLRNSSIVCVGTALLSVLLVVTTGYAFSRFQFVGRKYGLMAMLLIQMFPAQMSFVAFYYLLNYMNHQQEHLQRWTGSHVPGLHFVSTFPDFFLNNFPGLILVYLGGGIPFNAWLFKGFVDGLPRDLEESAAVDGATAWQAFYKIMLPLTRPMMAVIFIFTLFGNYNEYILANFLLSDPNKQTMAVGLRGFINGQFTQNWAGFAAAAVIASIPMLVSFLTAQKWLVSGLAAGAVKG